MPGPITRSMTRIFHRTLFAGFLQSITLLKRQDDLKEGVVTAYTLFQCRKSRIFKTGQPLAGDVSTDYTTIWHLPKIELDRVGVAYINVLDRIYDPLLDMIWQPEARDLIEIKLFGNHIDVHCRRIP